MPRLAELPFKRGILFTSFAGVFLFLGLGIVMGWELPEWPWWVYVVDVLALVLLGFASYVLLDIKYVGGLIAGILLCIAGAAQMAVLGIDIGDIPLITDIPKWPDWSGVLLIVLGSILFLLGVGQFYDVE